MHQFKVGEKVIVKAMSERPYIWAEEMNKYMGTVQEIESLEEDYYGTKATLSGCKTSLGRNWIFRTEDLMPIPEPGDKVKIRSWEDMEKQYGTNRCGDINCKYRFTQEMKEFAGGIFEVSDADEDSIKIKNAHYNFEFGCLAEVLKKEDEEMKKFTKSDLKDGMIVEYRNGCRRIVIGKRLLGTYAYMPLSDYNQDLTASDAYECDIVKIYRTNDKATGIKDLLESEENLELIWERTEAKEIPASEAIKILREKFGCEVKLVEDKND